MDNHLCVWVLKIVLFFTPGKSAKSNAELVDRAVSLVHQIGYDPATCEEAGKILKLR